MPEQAAFVGTANAGPRPSSTVRPTSWSSAAASSRSCRSRGWSCAVSRQSVATPTVCSSSPPAYEWWSSGVAGIRARARGRASTACDRRGQARVRDLGDEELEEAGELVGVAPHRRGERRGVDVGRLERAHVELQPVAELLDPAEHAHRVAFAEAAVEQLDVVPDARLDPAGRVDELEREVRRRRTSSAACASSSRRRRPRRRGLPRAPRSSPRQPIAASRCGSRRVVAPLGDLVEDGRRLLPPPAERAAEIGGGELAWRARARSPPARASRPRARAGASAPSTCARAGRGRASPTCCLRRPRCAFVRTSRWWSDAIDRSTSFFASPVALRSCGPVSGPSSRIASTMGSPSSGAVAVRGDERRQQPRRDARDDARRGACRRM